MEKVTIFFIKYWPSLDFIFLFPHIEKKGSPSSYFFFLVTEVMLALQN